MLRLYTKDKCFYCRQLKKKLDEWNVEYTTFPIDKDRSAAAFMEQRGHTTVPQLYYNNTDVQRGESTRLTHLVLNDRIERVAWPNIDGGIE